MMSATRMLNCMRKCTLLMNCTTVRKAKFSHVILSVINSELHSRTMLKKQEEMTEYYNIIHIKNVTIYV